MLYTALIAFIWYEGDEEEKNLNTLLDLLNESETREEDETYQNPVDMMFQELEERDPQHFAVRQYKKYKMAAGDATLKGAVYGLYAREDIVHPDGATGTIYKAGEQVASLTTDDKGQSSVNGLYLGKYYVKEITPPIGYLADTEEHDLTCSYEGDMTAEVKRECTSSEQVIKQPFQIGVV